MNKLSLLVSVAALFIAGIAFFSHSTVSSTTQLLGGFTNYDQIAISSSTPAAAYEVVVGGTGTTTMALESQGVSKPGCIELTTSNGSTTRAFLSGTSSPAWVLQAGTCK